MSDARRPWSDTAEIVDLALPAVSDRVARLQEMDIIRRFTLDIDRSQLSERVPVLLTVAVHADRFEPVRETLLDARGVSR